MFLHATKALFTNCQFIENSCVDNIHDCDFESNMIQGEFGWRHQGTVGKHRGDRLPF